MYRILSNQKKRVIEGKYSKDSYLFLVEQAFEKGKLTEKEYKELIEFNNEV
jgi:hypothetical protein|nr:MAG TPA: protein of unknown function DUF1974 [Caudoviricetes sp.]